VVFLRKPLLRFVVWIGESVLPACGSISTVVTAPSVSWN